MMGSWTDSNTKGSLQMTKWFQYLAALLALIVLLHPATAFAESFAVDPEAGNSTMQAVFDAPLGERINAVSSAVACDLDLKKDSGGYGLASGACRIPLVTINVDSDATKTEHFRDWATNRESEWKTCNFELKIKDTRTTKPVSEMQQIPFKGKGKFTLCGKEHEKNKEEEIEGFVVFLPAGTRNPAPTVKIRATIHHFSRDAYKIGPEWTQGWLARVQKLADVVAHEGDIEVNIFAVQK